MAWSAKTAKPRLFSTWLDVLTKAEEIKTTIADFADSSVTSVIMEQPHIEQLIYESDNLIRNYLRKYYTEANFRTTPWVTAPIPSPDNDDLTKVLQSVSIETSTAYTSSWVITFENTTEFMVVSGLEGYQGVGNTSTNFTSKNGDILIDADAWNINTSDARYLLYDGQTGNFTVGLTVTGTTSSATGVIVADTDWGTEGVLLLNTISGTFQDNEAITDSSTGAATINGTTGETYLAYDAQTVNLTVGNTLSGATSLVTGTIKGIQDDGATGKLVVWGATGIYTNNELLSDGTGDGTVNSDSTVASSVMAKSMTAADKFYFSIIDSDPLIWTISTKLATAEVLSRVYKQQDPNQVSYDRKLRQEAMRLLDRLSRPNDKDGLKLGALAVPSGDSIWIDYNITETGADISSYLAQDETPYM